MAEINYSRSDTFSRELIHIKYANFISDKSLQYVTRRMHHINAACDSALSKYEPFYHDIQTNLDWLRLPVTTCSIVLVDVTAYFSEA